MADKCLSAATFICAHGAGGHKDDAAMLRLARALEPAGFEVVRFNFPYREKGSKRIDPMPVLKDAFRNRIKDVKGRLILGGRSMGGRVASMLAAEGFRCDGLLLAAYPLHPAGAPQKRSSTRTSPRAPRATWTRSAASPGRWWADGGCRERWAR